MGDAGDSGRFGPPNLKVGGISGQGGGRILPGAAGGVGEVIITTPRIKVTADLAPGSPDHRPSPPCGSHEDTAFTAPGGGPGEPGKGDDFVIYKVIEDGGVTSVTTARAGGGGGGWGACGGATGTGDDRHIGAAGGKAIETNGHAVTWASGSTRAFGAIG